MRPPLILLAGGKGTRLGSLTRDIPKPMIDIEGKPFLYWLIKKYIAEGFDYITISTGFKSEVIENYNWPWALTFNKDNYYANGAVDYYLHAHNIWICNGDTWIKDPLPEVSGPTILSHNDVDAGAQFTGIGKIKIHPVSGFFDIGTPYGLEVFREYFRTNLNNLHKTLKID